MTRGSLVVFEGPDGVGKSTIISALSDHLKSSDIVHSSLSFPGKEPGTLGHLIYDLHHSPGRFNVEKMTDAAKQTLHIAAHLDTIERKIKPLLIAGDHVLLDRYWWSTLVYGTISGVNVDFLDRIIDAERFCWGSFAPSLILVVDRQAPINRDEDIHVWKKIRKQYRTVVAKENKTSSVKIIDNDGSLQDSIKNALSIIRSETNLFDR